jgi:acyl carrier protein
MALEITQDEVWRTVVHNLEEILTDQGQTAPAISPETLVGSDLGISSVDMIHLFIGLEERFDQMLDLQQIAIVDGEYRTDLSAGDLSDFIVSKLQSEGRIASTATP